MSKARVERASSIAKMTGRKLSKRGDMWWLVDRSAQIKRTEQPPGEGRPFTAVEDELFGWVESTGEIPKWLASHYRTWRDDKDGKPPRWLSPGYLERIAEANEHYLATKVVNLEERRR